MKQRKSEMIPFLKSYLDVPEDEAAKSYEFLVSHMPDNMIVDDAVIKKCDGIRGLRPQTEARCRPRHFQSSRLVVCPRRDKIAGRAIIKTEIIIDGGVYAG